MAEVHLFVDRIEDSWAVLIPDAEDPQEEPLLLSALPDDVREGDWLKVDVPEDHTAHSFFEAIRDGQEVGVEFIRDEVNGEEVKKQVQDLMNELSA